MYQLYYIWPLTYDLWPLKFDLEPWPLTFELELYIDIYTYLRVPYSSITYHISFSYPFNRLLPYRLSTRSRPGNLVLPMRGARTRRTRTREHTYLFIIRGSFVALFICTTYFYLLYTNDTLILSEPYGVRIVQILLYYLYYNTLNTTFYL